MWSKSLFSILKKVREDGLEPPTQECSILCSTNHSFLRNDHLLQSELPSHITQI